MVGRLVPVGWGARKVVMMLKSSGIGFRAGVNEKPRDRLFMSDDQTRVFGWSLVVSYLNWKAEVNYFMFGSEGTGT